MAFRYLNLHPKGKLVRDCVKRSLALASGLPYETVSKQLNALKKESGAAKFNDNRNWLLYVSRAGWRKLSFPSEKGSPRMNGERFCRSFPSGTYLLRMAGHLSVAKDGVIYDTFDCSGKCVYLAWKAD